MLYVSDLDGTLLGPDARLSASSIELLNKAIDAGANFTVATARTPATVDVLMADVRLKLPAIVMTGAALWDFETKTYQNLQFLTSRNVELVIRAFDDYRICPFIYILNSSCRPNVLDVFYKNEKPGDVDSEFIRQRSGLQLKKFHVGASVGKNRMDKVLLFFASGSHDRLCKIADIIRSHASCSVTCYEDIYNPGLGILEVFAHGVSKASAIVEMKNKYGFEDVTVFGDNINDLSMFKVADVSVAVQNSTPLAIEAANLVIGPNTSDAVPRYILENLR